MSKRVQIAGKELRVITVEAQEAIWRLAPRDWIGKRKAAVAGVARLLGWKFSRTWNIAHDRARIIHAEEMDQLRLRVAAIDTLEERANGNRERLNELIYARHEIARAGLVDRVGDEAPGTSGLRAGTRGETSGGAGPRHSTKTAARG